MRKKDMSNLSNETGLTRRTNMRAREAVVFDTPREKGSP